MSNEQLLFALTRLGIGHAASVETENINWKEIKALAHAQGLSAVVLDGIEKLQKQGASDILPDKQTLTQWIGEVLQGFDIRGEQNRRTIAELAGFYNHHGFKMMVLKGFACSLTWPKPEHRPCGDIDIWQFGQQKEADATLEAEKPVQVVQRGEEFKIDRSHHHHTVFYWRNFMVENHYDFINVHHHKSNIGLEKEFKRLGEDDSHVVEVYGEKVYLPSPNLHALFLLKHVMNDFTAFSVTLRQMLDWGFHVKRYEKEIDWQWLKEILEQYHMIDFFNCLNAICVEELGFDSKIFHGVQFNPALKDRVLQDILHPQYSVNEPSNLLPRLVYKFKRWKGNAWKHELCYKESMWSAFWSGVWNHLLKPKSI